MRRSVCYVTGTRADFGLMQATLQAIAADPRFDLHLVATGMHLDSRYGLTVRELEASGLHIARRISVDLQSTDGASMARNIGHTLVGLVTVLEELKPDIVLILGDRGEMLAAAIAASHLSIPVFHVHGGERSGTIDESVRHAISKLSHCHLVSTPAAGDRLVKMGESPDSVHWVGAPGLDGIKEHARLSRDELCRLESFNPADKIALLVFHPVHGESAAAGEQVEACLQALEDCKLQVIALQPNSDAGGNLVRERLVRCQQSARMRVHTHLGRDVFLSWLQQVDVMLGNSSSGIIEAASFGTPVINVGSRQDWRERNANVTDCKIERSAIAACLQRALSIGRLAPANIYGDGAATGRIVNLLATVDLSAMTANKQNAY